ncbi:Flp family type IVb pilin [Desulfovibrio ferrophilus]|uniref:Flp/fap pilin component n=1 Tax=Desulfovibrio ferrophilus TaxID=241368 RepID=A0A2Z6AY21_9BACT|nr:Flp family type IVb pilin [Desulfovibrio ferrophilus]MBU1001120.1 Flp family type IVb pilin [Pseudomonadota bacterium]BBD08118.1 flp/fap pilin component [Desulfovibrio ferrophilus]
MKTLMNLIRNEEGVTALEYGMIAALIAAVIAATVGLLGTGINTAFQTVLTAIGG